MADLQFGVVLHELRSRAELERTVRRADELGYDVIAAPDHLGCPSPFTLLTAAATMTTRSRLRTYMLNVAFWNPALLAREAATVDVISGGRLELGIGAGHAKREFDAAGIAWMTLDERIDQLETTVIEVRRLLEEAHTPAPVQEPIPIAVGGMSKRSLEIAARHAEIVGFAGLRQVPHAEPGTFTIVGAPDLTAAVQHVTAVAEGRVRRNDALLQVVALGDPEQTAQAIASRVPGLTSVQVTASRFVLLADDAHAAATELRHRHTRYGIDSWTTHENSLEPLGEVMAVLRRNR